MDGTRNHLTIIFEKKKKKNLTPKLQIFLFGKKHQMTLTFLFYILQKAYKNPIKNTAVE